MSWHKLMPDFVKKKICAYLIQRFFGKYFEEKLTINQLTLNLMSGSASLNKISLDVQALNELSENHNWPVEFVDGYIEELQIKIPWRRMLMDSSVVEINGLKITVQPKQRNEDAASMFESMWSSMTSSLKLAEDYVKQEANDAIDETQYAGVEIFASTIDFVLRKVQVKFVNTVIQIEHVPKDSLTGVGIVINIDVILYSDETENDPSKEVVPQQETENAKKAYVVQSFTTKNFIIEGVTISTVEFPSKARTFSRSMVSNISQENEDDSLNISMGDENKSKEGNYEQSYSTTINSAAENPNEFEKQRHVILFAKFSKQQVIKIRMKQSDETSTPKVLIDMSFGHFVLFLSPRQVHMLSELVAGLASPDLEDHSNVPQKSRCVEKLLTEFDYQRIENELQQQMRSPFMQMAGLQAAHGWSEAPLEENYTTENFWSMKNTCNESSGSVISELGGSLESSINSVSPSIAGTEFSVHTRRESKGNKPDVESSAEISSFNVKIASLGVLLLHEDLLNLNLDGHTFVSSSVIQMQQTAHKLFDQIGNCEFMDSAENNFDEVSATLSGSCQLNHIRLFAVPVRLEAKEKTTLSLFSISAVLDATKFELVECLFESRSCVESVPLLKFEESSSSDPPLVIKLKYVKKTVTTSRKNCPRTDVNVSLGKCTVEFDITIFDRISALLYPLPVCVIEKTNIYNPWTADPFALKIQSQQSVTGLKIGSSIMNLKLRFPVPDFRPSHDLNRMPWWKRHVRPDYLIFNCHDITFETSFHSDQSSSEYAGQCRCVQIYYNETEKGIPQHIAEVGYDDAHLSSMQEVSEYPRFSIKIFPTSKQLDIKEQEDIMTQSTFSPSLMNMDNGPFTSKRVVHESNTLHNKQPHEGEELIIPGDKEELEEFMRLTTESAKILIDFALPLVKMQLISKHIYELIYNRINNDLLLWEPDDPKTKPKSSQCFEPYSNMMPEPSNIFNDCKSGVQYASDSDTEDNSEEDGAILFYSTYDRPKSSASQGADMTEISRQSNLVLNLQITHGIVSYNTPVRDSTTNNVIPGQVGDFLMNVDNAIVFLVNGYKGNQELGYVSVQVERGGLFHCAMMPSSNVKVDLPMQGNLGKHLLPTIYKSERGILAEVQHENTVRDMLTVSCKIETKHETHHIKIIKVAIGLNQGTLRHRMCSEPNTWLSQMLDFVNVSDYPIPGYNSKEVVTELHIHMWDCAIDYRPLYLPLRSVISLGSFSMTSHLADKKNTSILRFIAEECNLFISEKAPPKNGVPSNSTVNVRKDYVNVLSLGLFDLSLRITDKNCTMQPHIDMRIANDCVHIYTCADSGKALTQLITYVATDGDLKSKENVTNVDNAYSSPKHHPTDQELISVEKRPIQDISQLTKSQYQHVDQLLGEALYDEIEPISEQKEYAEHSNIGAPQHSAYSNPRHYTTDQELSEQQLPIQDISQLTKSEQENLLDDEAQLGNYMANIDARHHSAYSSPRHHISDQEPLSEQQLPMQDISQLNNSQRQHAELIEETMYAEEEPQQSNYIAEHSIIEEPQHSAYSSPRRYSTDQELLRLQQIPIQDISQRQYGHFHEETSYDEAVPQHSNYIAKHSNLEEPQHSAYHSPRRYLTDQELPRLQQIPIQDIQHGQFLEETLYEEAKSQQSNYIAKHSSKEATQQNIYSSGGHSPNDLLSLEQLPKQNVSQLTNSQDQHVDQLLEEALYDEAEPQQRCYIGKRTNTQARLCYFPVKNQVIENTTVCNSYPQIVKELGDLTLQSLEDDIDDDFYFIDKEADLGLFPKNGVPEIKWLTNDPVRVIDNHFSVPVEKKDMLETPDNFPVPKYKYTLCKMNIIWHMFGGNDFKRSKKEKKEKRVNFDDINQHDSVYFSNSEEIIIKKDFSYEGKSDPKLSWKARGGVNRDHKVLMELELNKVQFQHEVYPETTYQSSRQVLLISELEIRDLLAKSEFNKFLYQYTSSDKPKKSQGHMVVIKAVHIRPDKKLPAEECCLRVSLLPLRFNIDQDSLKFIVNFFTELGQDPDGECDIIAVSSSKENTATRQEPVLTVDVENAKRKENKQLEISLFDDNLIYLDHFNIQEKPKSSEDTPVVESSNNPIFFRNIVFGPDVLIKIDYQGKRVELVDGSLVSVLIGLMMGLGQLNCSELTLKRISYRNGLLGTDKLITFLLQEWLNDVKKNQLPSLLSGIGPIYSFVQLFQGIKDLFWMPIEQYQKDGRIVRGIQRGANSFTTSTAMAALELTSRLIHLIQFTAETAYDMLSPSPCVKRVLRVKGRRKRYNQPQDLREGVTNAYFLVKHGFGETAEAIAQAATFECDQSGYTRAVGGVLRQIPPTILKPIIIASEATNNVLGGMKFQLLPDARNEANQKWRCKDE